MSGASRLGAAQALDRVADGSLSCTEWMSATLQEIERREPGVQAWVRYDGERALAAARRADAVPLPQRGRLHGLPLAVKDTFDSFDFPTEWGGKPWLGRQPRQDARMVALARAAGAIVIGKTVTTEYALLTPGKTRNPHDLASSPGGSSSGSAAAVAACMAPLALGSQTNGSMLRPASYCGVYGLKPTYGVLPRMGLAVIAPEVDTPGIFARDLGGLARALEVMAAHEPDDPASVELPVRGLEAALAAGPARGWRVGFVRTPQWGKVDPAARALLEEYVGRVARHADVIELELPRIFEQLHANHFILQDSGVARQLWPIYAEKPQLLSSGLAENVRRGHAITEAQAREARELQGRLRAQMDAVLSGVDVAVSAATTGEAPATCDTTGDPVMSTIWTHTGTPALSAPRLTGPRGLPLGVQITARRGQDAAVLAFAAFLEARVP